MTSGSELLPYVSRLRARLPKDARPSDVLRLGLTLLEEKRWRLLRSTGDGFAAHTTYQEMRYAALKSALLALVEAEELRPAAPSGRDAEWLERTLHSPQAP